MARRKKKVEVDIDRADINKADLRESKSRKSSKGRRFDEKEKENDRSWYSHHEQLLKDVASFAFSQPLGTQIDWEQPASSLIPEPGVSSIAGLYILTIVPSIGPASGSSTDPINVASNANYNFIRRSVSTYANYDAPDYMQYLIAMDSAYSLYAEAVRAYGLMQIAMVYNRYYPRAIVKALKYDYDSLMLQMADFRALINQFAFKLAQFCVPMEMDYFKRHVWMNQNIFYDSNTVKAQTYAYRFDYFYQYAEQTEGPAKLILKAKANYYAANGTIGLEQLSNMMNDVLLPLMESQDIIAMSGDTLRAFGQDRLYVMSPIAENYVTMPVMSYEVLSQFENATLCGDVYIPAVGQAMAGVEPDITQQVSLDFGGPGLRQHLAFRPQSTNSVNDYAAALLLQANRLLNFHKDSPDPGDVMVATRLMNIASAAVQQTPTGSGTLTEVGLAFYDSIASEAACRGEMYYMDSSAGNWGPRVTYIYDTIAANVIGVAPMIQAASLWTTFDWAPSVKLTPLLAASETNSDEWELCLDVDNYTVLNLNDLKQLTQVAMLSLFSSEAIQQLATKPIQP